MTNGSFKLANVASRRRTKPRDSESADLNPEPRNFSDAMPFCSVLLSLTLLTRLSPVVQQVVSPSRGILKQDLHLGLSGVLFTCEEFLEIVEDLMFLEFSAYHLDVDFRTAYLRCLSEVDILMVRSEHPFVITVAGGSSQKQGQKEEIAEYINPFVNSIRLVQ